MPESNHAITARALRTHALAYPETSEEFPWGESAFKVKGKTFVFLRADESGVSFSVKLPQSRDTALKLPRAEPTHYGLGAKGWVTLRPDKKTALATLYALIEESYRAVAPKRLLARIDAAPAPGEIAP